MYGGIPKDYDGIHLAQSRAAPRSRSFVGPRPASGAAVRRANIDPSYTLSPLPDYQ